MVMSASQPLTGAGEGKGENEEGETGGEHHCIEHLRHLLTIVRVAAVA
jgi:hypothetical protein